LKKGSVLSDSFMLYAFIQATSVRPMFCRKGGGGCGWSWWRVMEGF
jgi:hypothetical protein